MMITEEWNDKPTGSNELMRLNAQPQPSNIWQPIETAPRDYTHVIGIDAKGCVARTWFFAPSSLTRQWLRVGLPGKRVWHPTHWRPLYENDLAKDEKNG